jgi:aspartyl-tRNA(Asn)/glutamyl-tRNA(Gln) amidotransferase subunit A
LVVEAIEKLRINGHAIKDISLPHTEYAAAVYYILADAEASANLARFDGARYGISVGRDGGLASMYSKTRSRGFGPEVKRRIMLGTFALSAGYYDAYYGKAMKVRRLIERDFERAWDEVDVIITPTSPTAAFRRGEKLNDPLAMYLSDILTIPASLAGIPAISIPCGRTSGGRPVGLQIMAPYGGEADLLNAAVQTEQLTGYDYAGN